MDESQWETLLSQVRGHQADARILLNQWSLLPLTPRWEGPAQAAALSQLHSGEDLAHHLVAALDEAESRCADELRRLRLLSEASRGVGL